MLSRNKIIQKIIMSILMISLIQANVNGQTTQPKWWFGMSAAANVNFYDGTTQRLNNTLFIPTAFHKGNGVRPFGSFYMEYRSARPLGFMLNIGYDGRGGKFDSVIAPCNCPATLKTNIDYITIEPSLRLSVPSSGLYFFAGPRLAFNLQKEFAYTQLKQPNTDSDFTEINTTQLSGQVGVGFDIPISAKSSSSKASLSPFVSFHPYFGQDPRKIESWSLTTVRAGITLKFGKGAKAIEKESPIAVIPVKEVSFTVREPKSIPSKRLVSETLPLRNSVFFNEGSSAIPERYILLSADQASNFKEEQLQKDQAEGMNGRSARQLNVYHNVLNILGDRLRSNPGSSILLSGASGKGAKEGKLFAENIKTYLVSMFGINNSRISTEGRTKPVIPSEQPGGTKELPLLRVGDRRVDFTSNSPELMLAVGGGMMKPIIITTVQVDPLDSHVIFNVAGANDVLKSWSLNITDEAGLSKNYGPFNKDQQTIPGKTILGNKTEGNYKVTMNAESKSGLPITKESTFRLTNQAETIDKAYRYSILFDFNKSFTVASYETFIKDIVAPQISDGSTIIVHGHTDIIGNEDYNHTLSHNRAQQTQKLIESALVNSGKNNVKFETIGFGEDLNRAPFENNLPEERFYNRTVIIDIIPLK
jgi:outer membrane protein OmpA-like peptidoglycan-associated protein